MWRIEHILSAKMLWNNQKKTALDNLFSSQSHSTTRNRTWDKRLFSFDHFFFHFFNFFLICSIQWHSLGSHDRERKHKELKIGEGKKKILGMDSSKSLHYGTMGLRQISISNDTLTTRRRDIDSIFRCQGNNNYTCRYLLHCYGF